MLSVRNLVKFYGDVQAVKGISFEVKSGDFFTLLGPSGCGKTTTLQSIAGLELPTSGEIVMAGDVVFSSATNTLVSANRRQLGMVFQSYAIWPHMTVYENVAFPLVYGVQARAAGDVRSRVMQALDTVKMADYADRPAPLLSGGQQQRVALARAIVHQPRLLLLDEPLSNLDAKLRDAMRVELRQLIKHLGITTVFVTHDQLEAMSMSDQIVLMRDGKIEQMGPPREVFLRPGTRFAADFMGRSNLIPCYVLDSDEGRVRTPFGELECLIKDELKSERQLVTVIRPQAIIARPATDAARASRMPNSFVGSVVKMHFLGDVIEAEVKLADFTVRTALDPYLEIAVGTELLLEFRRNRCVAVASEDAAGLPGQEEVGSLQLGRLTQAAPT